MLKQIELFFVVVVFCCLFVLFFFFGGGVIKVNSDLMPLSYRFGGRP